MAPPLLSLLGMKSLNRALLTVALAVVALGGLEGSGARIAFADESGLPSDQPDASEEPATYTPPSRRAPAAATHRVTPADRQVAAGVRVILDEPVEKKAVPVPLAADVAEQTLGMGLSTEPALAASLVALGCLIGWGSRRRNLTRRGAWAH